MKIKWSKQGIWTVVDLTFNHNGRIYKQKSVFWGNTKSKWYESHYWEVQFMKKLLELNRIVAKCNTLAQGVVKSHYNLLQAKYDREKEIYNFMLFNGSITKRDYNKVVKDDFNNLLEKVKKIALQVS